MAINIQGLFFSEYYRDHIIFKLKDKKAYKSGGNELPLPGILW
jgi:hypothetical protein